MRQANVRRDTSETRINLELNLDGTGRYDIETGVGFFDHMLEQLARHARFDLTLRCAGDVHIDAHHTVEDVGIALGEALAQAVGDKRGISRYGSFLLPMDEALVLVALDLSGRAQLEYGLELNAPLLGTMSSELVREFLLGLTRAAALTLHVRQLAGSNSHHIAEAAFKGLGRALRQAVAADAAAAGEIPSTKGVL